MAVHASAVAIAGRGLLITGRSKAGKSRLAATLIAASTPQLPVVLIGDDRILLDRDRAGRLRARAHPRIAGFIEKRGLGIVAVPWRERALLCGLLQLEDDAGTALASTLRDLPRRRLEPDAPVDIESLLAWWRTAAGMRHHDGPEQAFTPCRGED